MTKPKSNSIVSKNDALVVEQSVKETDGEALARTILQPGIRHGLVASGFGAKTIGSGIDLPGIGDFATYISEVGKQAKSGDLAMASRMLAAQAVTLDSMFIELARRAAANMGEYINASDTYGRLALKAQGQCRATLEALAKLHQPREQTVRHVHVNEGGQAIVAEQFHHHAGGGKQITGEQSHATGAIGSSAALPCPDAGGDTMPVAGGQRPEAVPDARRD